MIYQALTGEFGIPYYDRLDAPATAAQKAVLRELSPDQVPTNQLAGETIQSKMTRAPGNGQPIGGLKVSAANGWFAARPSGTEDVYKIYAESFKGPEHLAAILEEAQAMVQAAFEAVGLSSA
jgi:phosphoglucomutase